MGVRRGGALAARGTIARRHCERGAKTPWPRERLARGRGTVDLECIPYRTVSNPFKRIAARLGPRASEKAALFGGTVSRAFRRIDPRSSDRDRHG